MCTAVSFLTKSHYFGRNLDLERSYGEGVLITPRAFPLRFRYGQPCKNHSALIGMGIVADGYPLYFEATNEHGLSMAGLNFPGNARYRPYDPEKVNVAPFELIPYVLSGCSSVAQVTKCLKKVNVADCNFSDALPVSPLHWLISDGTGSVVLECTEQGMQIHDDPYGVLTNNPTFDYHLLNVQNYRALHEGAQSAEDHSLGMGAMGLPGDFSSQSRFVRAVFVREKSRCDGSEAESVSQFFHILRSVAMPRGCVQTPSGAYEYTRYSCCCNTDTGVYYYTTYENSTVRQVSLRQANLEGAQLQFTSL